MSMSMSKSMSFAGTRMMAAAARRAFHSQPPSGPPHPHRGRIADFGKCYPLDDGRGMGKKKGGRGAGRGRGLGDWCAGGWAGAKRLM
uniref:Uncharacterized protein n=1 Tax=Oryza glumipatula TaxID=40148 RepID=A0A0D9Z9Z7_9ORYZ